MDRPPDAHGSRSDSPATGPLLALATVIVVAAGASAAAFVASTDAAARRLGPAPRAAQGSPAAGSPAGTPGPSPVAPDGAAGTPSAGEPAGPAPECLGDVVEDLPAGPTAPA